MKMKEKLKLYEEEFEGILAHETECTGKYPPKACLKVIFTDVKRVLARVRREVV